MMARCLDDTTFLELLDEDYTRMICIPGSEFD